MYKIYTVEYGDTIDSIANKFSTTKSFLERINSSLTNIYPGFEIIVPISSNSPFETYIVKKGDNIYEISKEYGTNYKDILLLNGLEENDYIYPNQELIVLKRDYDMYLVKDNETINDIANKINVAAEDLVKQNAALYLIPNQVVIYKKEKTI